MLFRTRDLPVRQRTQLINALRGHLAEHGVGAPQGPANLKILAEAVDAETTSLPLLVMELSRVFLEQIDGLSRTVTQLEKATTHEAARGATTLRLQTMPDVGPITAIAIETFAPPMAVFESGRDFAAWLGLVPRQHSTGAKQVLRKTSKWGQRDIRRLLSIGATTVVRRPWRPFAMASFSQRLPDWIEGQTLALAYIGGVSKAIVYGNLKAAVVKAVT